MEIKKNKIGLISSVFGALFVVGAVIFWVDEFRVWSKLGLDVVTGLKHLFGLQIHFYDEFYDLSPQPKDLFLRIYFVLVMLMNPLPLIFNIIGWVKTNYKFTLISGIFYFIFLNLISAPLCIIEYFDKKHKINNKLLFYTMIYTLIFNVMLIAFCILMSKDGNFMEYMGGPFWIYMISAIIIGLILNFIAWKTSNDKAKIIAGVFYLLGIFTLISAVICFISGKDYLKAIKNKLLFYAMVFSFGINAIIIAVVVSIGSEGKSMLYFIFTAIVGLILNFIAWKTNNKKIKIIAGIVYILGMFTVISAILCFISCKNNLKPVKDK